jgi:predicted house-cleaning noncanonical NTP pyrophosphatase (MazG superfamily)
MLSRGTAVAHLEAVGLGDEVADAAPTPQGVGRYLVKLVRDRVERLEEPPEAFGFHPLGPDDHITQLRQKLIEECAEYLIAPSDRELADVLEVVRCLAAIDLRLQDHPDDALEALRLVADAKRSERGGFEEGIGMFAEWVVRA